MPTPTHTPDQRKHAHDRALALGYASASSGALNPYARGTQCWILFNLGLRQALEAAAAAQKPATQNPKP